MTEPQKPSEYVLTDASEAERERLALLQSIGDPVTCQRLERTGIGAGWACMEVGAGHGSIARWMAERVGPTGRVVAADLNTQFLVGLPETVEVRRVDVRTEELGAGEYDLIHCRTLLMHLPDPLAALRRMAAALRPGGWLVAEEADFGLHWLAGHPDAEWANELVQRQLASFASAMDPYLGRRLPGLVAALGLDAFGGESAALVGRGDHPVIEFQRRTFRSVREHFRRAGISDADLDRQAAVFAAPETVMFGMVTVVAAWGRKPA